MSNNEVVIIGSGAGGAAFAWALASAGVQVRILEAGPRYDPATDYRLSKSTWEQSPFPSKVSIRGRQTNAPLQKLQEHWNDLRSWNHLKGNLVTSENRIFAAYSHEVGVGGSTLHYAGESHRMHPDAMAMQSRFGVAADWPFSYDDLEPYYVQAEKIIGVAGLGKNDIRRRSEPYPLPEHALSYASKKLGEGCQKLGMSWVPNSIASLSRPYDGRPPCNYCGQCARGCPRFDKGTADITFIAKALATGNCKLDTISQVLQLETTNKDRVKAAIYADSDGNHHRIEGDLFAVACGAVETPRLLLNSTGATLSEGLANESGLVGRNFMETLFWTSSGLHPEALASYRGLPSDAICWDFNAPDAIPDIIGGCRFSPVVLESDISGPINYAQRVVGGWGRSHKAAMREQFGRVLSVGGIGESLPDPGSFIALDAKDKDKYGLPKARIHSHLADMELKRLRFMAQTCRKILEAAGVDKLVEEYGAYDMFNSTHVFGTCRMGIDPTQSVVDKNCRSHRWRNLMVVEIGRAHV